MMNNRDGMGVGYSRESDSLSAAHEACVTALAGRTPKAGDLMMLFPTIEYDPRRCSTTAAGAGGAGHVLVGCSVVLVVHTDAQVSRGTVAAFLPTGDLSFGVAGVDAVGLGHLSAPPGRSPSSRWNGPVARPNTRR